ncbi:MAG: threonine/serine exporter family protein [Acetobacterium sp.]
MTGSQLSHVAMEIGIVLLSNGAETYRVDESMHRICMAMGAYNAEIFVLPTNIILGITIGNGEHITRTRRIHSRGIDLQKVELINNLSRQVCYEEMSYSEILTELHTINSASPYHYYLQVLAFAFVAQMFTLFFGGNFQDSCIGFIIGFGIKLQMDFMARLEGNIFFINIVGGFIAAVIALAASGLGLTSHMDAIIIGSIMTLVPGLSITNSIRDIIAGDYLSGLVKGVEALLIGTGIATGVAIPLSLLSPFWGV